MSLIEHLLDRIFSKKVIVNCDRDPYLHRWFVIRTDRLGLFIHKFVRSDEDRALHDHPWDFLVIPVWRGYIEHRNARCTICGQRNSFCTRGQESRRVLPIVGTRFRRGEYRHRVELIDGKPSWSIFFRFRKRREWGFWDRLVGFIPWNKWWQERCE